MKMPKKWVEDREIWTYPDFEQAVESGRLMFVTGLFRARPTSGRVVANMSYALVTHCIRQGRISLAVQSEEYRDWLRDELLGRDRVEWWEKDDGPPLLLSEEAS